MSAWVQNDGGREAAGFSGQTDDCVVRAIAIAAELPYREVYDELYQRALDNRKLMAKLERRYGAQARTHASPRTGVRREVYDAFLADRGWVWVATMKIGEGCKVHLREPELPIGRLVVRLSKHLCAVVDGQVHDIFDPSRGGTRCVYGYWQATR